MELEDVQDRSADFDSDIERDILDEDDDEDVVVLDKADAAAISRERSLNRSAKGTSIEPGPKKPKPIHVNPHQRVQEFPDECLAVSGGKLFCDACHHIVNLKKSVVEKHIESRTHLAGKEKRKSERYRQQRVAKSWDDYQKRHGKDLSGAGLTSAIPVQQSLRRVAVVTEFLKAGIPLAKIDSLRLLLEDGSERLTDSSHMATYVPFVLETEKSDIMDELKDKPYVTAIFDGSTYQGEALVVILRYVTADYEIRQRLVSVRILAKSLTGQQLAREILTVLSTQLQYPSSKFIAVTRDGASVNGAAVKFLKEIMYPDLCDIICMSHSLDNVGKRFQTPLLDSFLRSWVSLFAHSPAARIAWRGLTGEAIKSYSRTRWWSWWEMLQQLYTLFDHVSPFLQALECSPTVQASLLHVMNSPDDLRCLRMQLAVTVDAGKLFVKKTYLLEGDGEMVVDTYVHLQELLTACSLENYPEAAVQAQAIAGDNAQQVRQLMAQAKDCVAPTIHYFRLRFNHREGNLFGVLRIFKALRILCPVQARQMHVGLEEVNALRALPCLDNDETITNLQEELPIYLAAADDVVLGTNGRLKWWQQQDRLPHWQQLARIVFALLPSSAPAERVFSLLQASTSNQQGQRLSDQIEATLMLQYNRR